MILASAYPMTLTLALGTSAAYAACAYPATRTTRLSILGLAWGLHGLLLTWSLWGDARHFGFAPALSMTMWLAGLVYAFEIYFYPKLHLPTILTITGSGVVLLALWYPGAALGVTASAWLPLHGAFGMASYGLFAVAVIHAGWMTRSDMRIRQATNAPPDLPLLTLERLIFRFVGVGFVLLSATLLAGFFFGTVLYGSRHALKFDHKTTFSVLSWLTFAVLMVGRIRFGWRGKRAIGMLYVGSGLLLLAYVGSHFFHEVMLGQTP